MCDKSPSLGLELETRASAENRVNNVYSSRLHCRSSQDNPDSFVALTACSLRRSTKEEKTGSLLAASSVVYA